uniref:ribosomal protein L20 n=1 Tax=Juncus alatus TaxID=1274368 RepID=UPI001F135D29|nr:ribosomal protein L20 [Juncus alatus]YP_010692383.1 ribosomal protein L20 [Juncus validus]ULQ66530.1 ribosomal protein L20 [Juncus alatus]UZM11345.1 ribosomal protein L20 [Juncus validus]
MTRVTRGYIARRRRRKNRSGVSGFRGAHSRHTRTINQQKMRALVYSHQDRGRKKRDFRRLWITRINAVIRENKVFTNYSKFIHNLYKKQFLLNRKILSKIAISNRISFDNISNKIIKESRGEEDILNNIYSNASN